MKISAFGPLGLASSEGDAPGSFCVMTVPGLTAETTPEPPLPVFVVAGNQFQFYAYRRSRGLTSPRDFRYVVRAEQLHGLMRARFILTGSYSERYDWPQIKGTIEGIGIAGEAIVEVHPVEASSRPTAPASTSRRQTMRVSLDLFGRMLKEVGTTVLASSLPNDARLVNRLIDERGDLLLLWESATFPETPEGERHPEVDFVTLGRSPMQDAFREIASADFAPGGGV